MTSVYVASHCPKAANEAVSQLRQDMFSVVSTWHDLEFNPTSSHTESDRADIAARDAKEVAEADALVLVAGPEKYSGGKFVEAGIAIGLGKRVVVLGRRENMLLWLPGIACVSDKSELAEALFT